MDYASCFYNCERKFMHQNLGLSTLNILNRILPGKTSVFWFPLLFPAPDSGLIVRMQPAVEAGEREGSLGFAATSNRMLFRGAQPDDTLTMPTSPSLSLSYLGCQWQNDFLTLPRLYKELGKKILQTPQRREQPALSCPTLNAKLKIHIKWPRKAHPSGIVYTLVVWRKNSTEPPSRSTHIYSRTQCRHSKTGLCFWRHSCTTSTFLPAMFPCRWT